MLRVRDIMTEDVLSVSPELSLRDAMDLLSSHHVSGAPVVAAGNVIGVISATDLLSFAASLPGVPSERLVQEEPGAWDDSDRSDWAEDEAPGAFFTGMWEDAGADVVQRFSAIGGPEWNVLEEHTVSEAMNQAVCTITPEMPVDQAADLMRSAGVHRMIVVHHGDLVGILTTKDIANAVADHKLTARTYVFSRAGRGIGPSWEP